MDIKVKKLSKKNDDRGWLAEILRSEDISSKEFGMILMTTAKPGYTKGNHYHKRKTEWYCVIQGRGLLEISDNETGKETRLEIGEKNMVSVEIPPNHLHAIKNIGKNDMYLLVYVDGAFNPGDPDTFYDKSTDVV